MLVYKTLDATSVQEGIIAHGVNCQHKMGSGIAKTIREKWPHVYEAYMNHPKGSTMLGRAHIIWTVDGGPDLHVANVYTQVFYGYGGGRYASPDAIESGMMIVANKAANYGIRVYMPRIGCGLGGLDWTTEVEPRILRVANEFLDIDIVVCDLPNPKEDNIDELITY